MSHMLFAGHRGVLERRMGSHRRGAAVGCPGPEGPTPEGSRLLPLPGGDLDIPAG